MRPLALMLGLIGAAILPYECSAQVLDNPFSEYIQRDIRMTPDAGNANDANAAIHTIDPWPRYARHTRIPGNGRGGCGRGGADVQESQPVQRRRLGQRVVQPGQSFNLNLGAGSGSGTGQCRRLLTRQCERPRRQFTHIQREALFSRFIPGKTVACLTCPLLGIGPCSKLSIGQFGSWPAWIQLHGCLSVAWECRTRRREVPLESELPAAIPGLVEVSSFKRVFEGNSKANGREPTIVLVTAPAGDPSYFDRLVEVASSIPTRNLPDPDQRRHLRQRLQAPCAHGRGRLGIGQDWRARGDRYHRAPAATGAYS